MTQATFRYDERTLALKIENLPALTGSPKQIEWAEQIRIGLFQSQLSVGFDKARMKAVAEGKPELIQGGVALLNEKIAPLFTEASAKWWIDHRNCDIRVEAKKRLTLTPEKKQ